MDPHWFKLLVRAIGLMVLAFAAPALISSVLYLVYSVTLEESPITQGYLISYLSTIVGDLVQGGFGLYLLLGGGRLTKWCLRETFGSCPACGYDIRAVTGPVCPECGAPVSGRADGSADRQDAL